MAVPPKIKSAVTDMICHPKFLENYLSCVDYAELFASKVAISIPEQEGSELIYPLRYMQSPPLGKLGLKFMKNYLFKGNTSRKTFMYWCLHRLWPHTGIFLFLFCRFSSFLEP